MNRKRLYLLGAVLLLSFAAFSLSSFSASITPYVSFAEARSATRMVQVAGGLEKASSRYDDAAGNLHFTLLDLKTREAIPVRYNGLKPANFEDAVSIVAIGRYDRGDQEFVANQLLVKCPSKYQGAEVKTYS
ncbi:MAG TPA: cytochrome c maturation protein CcmE [Thermoanaerobaculia bacterium]|nr:cytochrome c maturation protein CcmE [Thermoanaerobaculia bacterium]